MRAVGTATEADAPPGGPSPDGTHRAQPGWLSGDVIEKGVTPPGSRPRRLRTHPSPPPRVSPAKPTVPHVPVTAERPTRHQTVLLFCWPVLFPPFPPPFLCFLMTAPPIRDTVEGGAAADGSRRETAPCASSSRRISSIRNPAPTSAVHVAAPPPGCSRLSIRSESRPRISATMQPAGFAWPLAGMLSNG